MTLDGIVNPANLPIPDGPAPGASAKLLLNGPMVDRLRRCAADTDPNWAGAITIYPPEARELVALIDRAGADGDPERRTPREWLTESGFDGATISHCDGWTYDEWREQKPITRRAFAARLNRSSLTDHSGVAGEPEATTKEASEIDSEPPPTQLPVPTPDSPGAADVAGGVVVSAELLAAFKSAIPEERHGWLPYDNELRPALGAVLELYLEALAAAGRLLPDGGETREEWGVHWHMSDSDDEIGIAATRYQLHDRAEAVKHGASRVGIHAITHYSLHRREHRIFGEHGSWSGPWVEIADAEA